VQADRRHSQEKPKTGGRIRRTGHWSPWLVFGAAALVALLVYLPTLKYDFVWDDNELIPGNPFLARTNPIELFTKGFWNNPAVEGDASYYRPLANLGLYVDRKVWGLRPAGYHLTNIIINTAVVLLMCLLLWELFGSVWLAGLGGLLVGIHPAMNCVVAFISNRTYLLALFFLLVSAYALARGRREHARVWPALFGGSFLLSALAVEASLVFAALAAAWLFVTRSRYRRFPVWMAAIASPLAVYSLLRLGIARVPFTSSVLRWTITEPLRVINAFGQQVQLLLFPFNQKVIYDAVGPLIGFSVYTILGLLFLCLPLVAVIRIGRSTAGRRDTNRSSLQPRPSERPEPEAGRLAGYGYAWMVVFLLPFAHLIVLGPAGRALYLAVPGVLILLAALFQAKGHQQPAARVVYGAVFLCTAVFAMQTLRRNPVWHDGLSLSQAMVREAPGAVGGHMNYGLALAKVGRKEEAIDQFRIAVGIDPTYVRPHISLAFALIDQKDLPGAIRELREVVRLQPESPKTRNDLAVTLMRNGQLDSAIVEYKEVLRLDPNSELTLNNLGYAYLLRGDFKQAIPFLRAALRIRPDLTGARRNLADAYRKAGMPDSAALVESVKP
jgi:protein O-mannosyl-transferase